MEKKSGIQDVCIKMTVKKHRGKPLVGNRWEFKDLRIQEIQIRSFRYLQYVGS